METTLRHFGNSVGLVIPKLMRDSLHFVAGQVVLIEQQDDVLIIKPSRAIKYTLDELMSQCDLKAPPVAVDEGWDKMPAVGKEIW